MANRKKAVKKKAVKRKIKTSEEEIKSSFWKKCTEHKGLLFFLTIFGIVLTILPFVCTDSLKKEDIQELATKKDIDSLMVLYSSIDKLKPSPSDSISLPGYSFSVLIQLRKSNVDGRQFIYDDGESMTKNRVSLYLDNENNLCFRILDKNSEANTIKLLYSENQFLFDEPLFLYCAFVKEVNYSSMKMYVNDKEVVNQKSTYSIDFEYHKILGREGMEVFPTNSKYISIGSDLEKNDGAYFNIYYFAKFKESLSNKAIRNFVDIMKWYLDRSYKLDNQLHYYSYMGDGKGVWK